MLLKAIVLIIIGAAPTGNVVVTQGPTFASAQQCQDFAKVFFAAAMVRGVVVTGLCVATPFPFKGTKA